MVGPISLSNYPHANMVSKVVKDLWQNLVFWVRFKTSWKDFFFYFCIGPVHFLLYINLKLYCSLAVRVSGGELLGSHLRSSVTLELLTDKVSLGQVSLEYFGVPCQYESTILTFYPHNTRTIHITLAKHNFVTWNTFSTELPSSKGMNR
jgi:hypothetical protein